MLMASEADNGNLNGTQSDLLATWLVGVLHKALIILHLDELRRTYDSDDQRVGHQGT